MPWIERVRTEQPLDAALDVANPLLKRLVSAINPVSGIDGAVTIPITRYGTINNQPTPFGVGAKSSSIAASNALCSTISSIGAADSTIILVVYNHALIADANNHFAGGSYRSGSLTTAIQLSNGAGTHYWQALTGNGSINTLSSNEVLPVGLSVLAHTQRGGLISIYRNGVLKNSTSAANGNSNDTFCICDIDGPAISNSTDRAILLGLKIAGALSASELAAIGSNPWQLFEKERVFVPVAAGGSSSTITQADGTSTAGALGGSASAASTPTAADGASTAASITASAIAAAGVTSADGTSTAGTLAGSAVNAASITQADGVSTAATLTGTGLADGAAGITPATGASATETLAGSSVAASDVSAAGGVSTGETLAGVAGTNIVAGLITPASGSTTASDFAASATAATVAIAAAGASAAATLTSNGVMAVAGAMAGRRMAVTGRRPDRLQTSARPAR